MDKVINDRIMGKTNSTFTYYTRIINAMRVLIKKNVASNMIFHGKKYTFTLGIAIVLASNKDIRYYPYYIAWFW